MCRWVSQFLLKLQACCKVQQRGKFGVMPLLNLLEHFAELAMVVVLPNVV